MFARLETWFNAFFLGYAARVSGDLAVGLVPIALLLVTVYVAVYGLAVMRGEATEPVGTFAWKMVKVGAILSFALPGLYYSGNVAAAATGLQDGLATLFVAPRAVAAATAFGALDLANTAANEQLALLWKDAGMFRLDLVLASLLFSLGTTIFLVLGAFVALLGKLILTFALAIGPMAILCLLFKPTARFFDSWLSFVLSAVVLSWFVFFALGMSLYVSDRVVSAIADGSAFVAGVPGSVGALEAAGTYLAVMCLLAIVLYQAPSLASSLTGGASIQSGAQMVTNSMVAMRAMGAGRAGGGAAAGGGSMSRGGGAAYVAGRAAGAVGSAGGAVAGGARAAYQRVAQRGGVST
ncbi:MAG: type IV secretion system protein [Sphaerotilus sp.]|jgi:type IV secretion system protein VirB6|nr:type IV secretion system protein [Sphaerotilus sp.]